ncbi:acyl-CoA dehydrogenase [Myxococcota bacterium]|nr:acyl-CoA dehydrogenase [Myxococcota bacterium]MBU1429366.1 acyl-CoA dehydrogenase [Myxococcota bacterium]MBU1899883.1 acyl-CoA dehydrogenase [Myxococcota bacterium]
MSLGLQDRRDVSFLVRDVLKVDRLFETAQFEGQSWETFEMIMDSALKQAEALLPTNVDGDREGLKFEAGAVTTPESFKAAYKSFCEGGWIGLTEPEDLGGFNLPKSLAVLPQSALIGANVAFYILPGLGHGAADLIAHAGTKQQIKRYVPKLLSGEWGGTMCLTEASAGSDVGALRATAKQQPDGTWHITGTKIFISWGEHDLSQNIVYPVLARVEGDPAGTRGISLFLVNKYQLDEKGRLGARNGVVCTGIEHKMGIHASPTCTLAFGEDAPAVGELIGEQRKGLAAMFKMMNTARIAVGLQALGVAEAAYRYAHQYALDRVQGVAPKDMRDPQAKSCAIIKHPDVRRMLMDMRGYVEGVRALLSYASLQQDLVAAGQEPERNEAMAGLLTPLCKGYASEVCYQAVSDSILVLGGHGYLSDHPLEQNLRDMVIARLYEGTTGIQALDLVARKLGLAKGASLKDLLGRMSETIAEAKAEGLAELAGVMEKTRDSLGLVAMKLGEGFAKGDVDGVFLQATPMLMLTGDAVLSWLHLMMAVAAKRVEKRAVFHDNKIATAQHFIINAAGRIGGRVKAMLANDKAAMEMKFEGEDEV